MHKHARNIPPKIIPIATPNKSHRPIFPNPEPNIPVNGIDCNIIAGRKGGAQQAPGKFFYLNITKKIDL